MYTDINIKQVSDISRSYIFFINNDRLKSTKDKLQSILIDINAELQYYKRLYDDLHNILENKHKKLFTMPCPSIEDINKANFSEKINLQEQREKYIEQCNKINGLYEYFEDITRQLRHYETLQYKIKSILNIE